jgi:hypothetical protein
MSVQKNKVFSFRMPKRVWNEIQKDLDKRKIPSCPNPHSFARKLLIDWRLGRLKYTNPRYRFEYPDDEDSNNNGS